MAYVLVGIAQITDWRDYRSAGFSIAFDATSAGVRNNDGQVVEVWYDNSRIFYREFSGNLRQHKFGNVRVNATQANFPANGSRWTFANVKIITFDKAGDGNFRAELVATGYSLWTPKINASSFTLVPQSITSTRVNYTNLDTPQNERLSYQNWAQNGYNHNTAGQKSGNFIVTGMQQNTMKRLARGMIKATVDDGFLGNGENRRVMIPTYPQRAQFSAGALNATRNGGNITINWGAWGNFGNLRDTNPITSTIQIINTTNNSVIASRNVNATNTGNTTFNNVASVPMIIRMRLSGNYFDGRAYAQTKDFTDFNIASNNTYVKVDGTWRKGTATYVKVNGVWRPNAGAVRVKTGGTWR